jgi:hypothetical protein
MSHEKYCNQIDAMTSWMAYIFPVLCCMQCLGDPCSQNLSNINFFFPMQLTKDSRTDSLFVEDHPYLEWSKEKESMFTMHSSDPYQKWIEVFWVHIERDEVLGHDASRLERVIFHIKECSSCRRNLGL